MKTYLIVLLLVIAGCGPALPDAERPNQPPAEERTAQPIAPEGPDAAPAEGFQTLRVGPQRAPCQGEAAGNCLVVDEQLFYNEIHGFDYAPGYEYELEVQVTRIEDPPADASGLRFDLVEIISQTPVDAEAAMRECPDEWYSNQMPCSCDTPDCANCADRQYLILDGQRYEPRDFDMRWVQDNCGIEPMVVS